MNDVKNLLQNKYVCAAIFVLALGVMLSMLFPAAKTDETKAAQTEVNPSDEEARLAQVLSCIDGAGQVQVMITYESSAEIVPAYVNSVNTSSQDSQGGLSQSSNTRTELAATSQDGALVLKELAPAIRGVVIIAQGADDFGVKMDLLQATVTVLQIEESQVNVFAMRKD